MLGLLTSSRLPVQVDDTLIRLESTLSDSLLIDDGNSDDWTVPPVIQYRLQAYPQALHTVIWSTAFLLSPKGEHQISLSKTVEVHKGESPTSPPLGSDANDTSERKRDRCRSSMIDVLHRYQERDVKVGYGMGARRGSALDSSMRKYICPRDETAHHDHFDFGYTNYIKAPYTNIA
jgi:hypothetical protein